MDKLEFRPNPSITTSFSDVTPAFGIQFTKASALFGILGKVKRDEDT